MCLFIREKEGEKQRRCWCGTGLLPMAWAPSTHLKPCSDVANMGAGGAVWDRQSAAGRGGSLDFHLRCWCYFLADIQRQGQRNRLKRGKGESSKHQPAGYRRQEEEAWGHKLDSYHLQGKLASFQDKVKNHSCENADITNRLLLTRWAVTAWELSEEAAQTCYRTQPPPSVGLGKRDKDHRPSAISGRNTVLEARGSSASPNSDTSNAPVEVFAGDNEVPVGCVVLVLSHCPRSSTYHSDKQ
jgi:hypothetical protein